MTIRAATMALLTALLLAVAVSAVACRDDGGQAPPTAAPRTATEKPKPTKDPSAPGEPQTAEALVNAVTGHAKAVYAGDSDRAYKDLLRACKDKLTRKDYAARLLNARGFFKRDEGFELSALTVTKVETQNVTPEQGEVRVAAEGNGKVFPAGDWLPWKYEDGAWRTTECPT